VTGRATIRACRPIRATEVATAGRWTGYAPWSSSFLTFGSEARARALSWPRARGSSVTDATSLRQRTTRWRSGAQALGIDNQPKQQKQERPLIAFFWVSQ
jgi:hypothetical protein